MERLNPNGTKEFLSRKGNVITPKQLNLIKLIEKVFDIRFLGSNSKEAYYFIQKYYKFIKYDRFTKDVYRIYPSGCAVYKGKVYL